MNDFKLRNHIYQLEELVRDLSYWNDGDFNFLIYELDRVKEVLQEELDKITE